jgi:hypothetical protein
MTGRRLYEQHCIARKETIGERAWGGNTGFRDSYAPVAWDYLPNGDRSFWNALARRITPKKRGRRA